MSVRRPHRPPTRKAISTARTALRRGRRGPALPKKPRKRSLTIQTGRPREAKRRKRPSSPGALLKRAAGIALRGLHGHFRF